MTHKNYICINILHCSHDHKYFYIQTSTVMIVQMLKLLPGNIKTQTVQRVKKLKQHLDKNKKPGAKNKNYNNKLYYDLYLFITFFVDNFLFGFLLRL